MNGLQGLMGYQEQETKLAYAEIQHVDLRRNLAHQLEKANAEVTRLTELLALLENNPDIARILTLLQR